MAKSNNLSAKQLQCFESYSKTMIEFFNTSTLSSFNDKALDLYVCVQPEGGKLTEKQIQCFRQYTDTMIEVWTTSGEKWPEYNPNYLTTLAECVGADGSITSTEL